LHPLHFYYLSHVVRETKVINGQSTPKHIAPILDLAPSIVTGKDNPELIVRYDGDTILCKYFFIIASINQRVVGSINDKHFIFEIKNHDIDFGGFKPRRAVPENEMIYHQNDLNQALILWGEFAARKNYKLNDSTYLFIKINYSDSLTGKKQKPFRKLFNIKRTSENKVFDLRMATFDEYQRVKQLLSKTNHW